MGGRALDNPELDTSPTKKIPLADTTVAERGGAEKDDFRPLLLLLVAPMALRGLSKWVAKEEEIYLFRTFDMT